MYLIRIKYFLYVVVIGLCFNSKLSVALEFDPGVGIGAQYTDNAGLTADNQASDVITTGYVGASITEDEGPLIYGADATLRKEAYVNDTFEDRNYLNLNLNAGWEMLRDRFDWFLSDQFSQRSIVSVGNDTPENRQDTNAFTFGADIKFPISGRQLISIIPQFNQYYYEAQDDFEVPATDNRQYSLAINWGYQMFRLTNISLDASVRKIEYDNQLISNTTFSNLGLVVSGQRVHSNYTVNLGATNVKRDTGEGDTGFTGGVNWLSEISSRSTIEVLVLSEITDTSTASQAGSPGNPNDVQLTTDVIRNSIINLAYSRADAVLQTDIFAEYRKIKYSDNIVLNRIIQRSGALLSFPVTQLVSSGVFVNFTNTKRENISLDDKYFNFGVDVNVTFANNWNGSVNVQFRTRENTESLQNYDEFSFFAGLSYGFGRVSQRSISY